VNLKVHSTVKMWLVNSDCVYMTVNLC